MHLSDSQVLRAREAQALREEAAETEGLVCLLTTLHPERALSRALLQHLSEEMPDITFTLDPAEHVSAVWVCGYEAGLAPLVAEQRTCHPRATLVVTGRDDPEAWREEVLAAGADQAWGWPVRYEDLSRALHRRRRA